MLNKIIASLAVVALFTGYAFYERGSVSADQNDAQTITADPITAVSDANHAPAETRDSGAQPVPARSPAPSSQPAVTPDTKKGRYADGTYTGSIVDAFYGNVQVRVTISGGLVSDVSFLQYPNDRGESRQISQISLPRLRSEAIAAQSAQIDGVSGATQTSEAFIQSLRSALSQAA